MKESEVTQSCATLCDPMDCSLPGSSVHGIFQARILEWVAISFSRGSSRPGDRTQVSCIVGRHFYHLSHKGSFFFFFLTWLNSKNQLVSFVFLTFTKVHPYPGLNCFRQAFALGKFSRPCHLHTSPHPFCE